MNKDIDFPQYRKLSNGKAFYRITSERSFDELQILGSKVLLYSFQVDKYPEFVRIQQMLQKEGDYEPLSPNDFESLLKRVH